MKRIILLTLVIIILFLAGCTSQVITPEVKSQSENGALNDCFSKIDQTPGESYIQYQKDLCRLSVAKESKNKVLCSGIDNENKKQECNKYFDELPFVEGTATKEDILEKCKCDYYCYGRIYEIDCIYKNVKNPQQCLSFIGLHYDNYISSPDKIYFEEGNLKNCLKSLISRTNDTSFCEESPELYFNFCEEFEQEKISEEKVRIASLNRHVMTDDKDEWIFPHNSLDEAKKIIEEWKKEGYENFRVFECNWDEEFEVCIDYNAIYDEGDQSDLECNRHLREIGLGSDFWEKYPDLLDKKFC